MGVTVKPLHPLFVGAVGGVDAGRPLDAEMVRALGAAIDRYAVLVLRGQDLDDERQMVVASVFRCGSIPASVGAVDGRTNAPLGPSSGLVMFSIKRVAKI